jgi:hypothetical protein
MWHFWCNGKHSFRCLYYTASHWTYVAELDQANTRAGSCPGLSPKCGLLLLLHKPKARACACLVFGLSPQSRPGARTPGKAGPQKNRARSVKPKPDPFYRPDPALANTDCRARLVFFCLHAHMNLWPALNKTKYLTLHACLLCWPSLNQLNHETQNRNESLRFEQQPSGMMASFF